MKFLLTLLIIFLFPEVFAHEEQKSEEFRLLKEVELKNGKVFVMAREDGHLLGQPFQIELRVHCDKAQKQPLEIPIKDSFSVCDIDPSSLKLNKEKTAIAMKVKVADLDSYYEQIEKGLKSPEVKCAQKTKIKKFSLKKLCE